MYTPSLRRTLNKSNAWSTLAQNAKLDAITSWSAVKVLKHVCLFSKKEKQIGLSRLLH